MVMIGLFQLLLVGHLIADFPLQTPTILRWKFRGGVWLLPHIMIHGVVLTMLVRNPFAVLIVFVTHFIIDWTKVVLDDGSRQGLTFLLDQSAHVLVLWLVAQYGGITRPELAVNHLPIILGLAIVSAVFMFLNVIKSQLERMEMLPKAVARYAFYVSKASGWTAVLSLLFSVQTLR
jgi:uncharacterized membrane protein